MNCSAYEFASASGHIEMHSWVCRATGTIYSWDSDTGKPLEDEEFEDEEEGEPSEHAGSVDETGAGDLYDLPADILDTDKYLPVPDKRELDLGSRIAFIFTRDVLPRDYDEVRRIFGRRGAYSRFKDLLQRRKALDHWHAFEREATEEALREWCKDNGIEIEEQKRP